MTLSERKTRRRIWQQKRQLAAWLLVLVSVHSTVQNVYPSRHEPLPDLAPFYHGVASGDPKAHEVILWTRITTDSPQAQVQWEMATDPGMMHLVKSGSAQTNADRDYTIKINIDGLDSYTYYYYRFEYQGQYSLVGRTKTAPSDADSVTQLRFALVSCSNYAEGYFNAYHEIVKNNDVDAVLHLGDYIYEYAANEYGSARTSLPHSETYELKSYRERYAHYRLDPDLREIHRQYPMIVTWDDHETADDAHSQGATNHHPGEGDWQSRKSASTQAFLEWLPLREHPQQPNRIFRKFHYGALADIFFLDTRLYARSAQQAQDGLTKSMIGEEQYHWLTEELAQSDAKWKIIAQQVMFAPLQAFGQPLNSDQWDAYAHERNNLLGFFEQQLDSNVVILTGDMHTTWANELPLPSYQQQPSGERHRSAGVEFVVTSVTSASAPWVANLMNRPLRFFNPHIKHLELSQKGHAILDIRPNQTQCDWKYVSTIAHRDYQPQAGKSYRVASGCNCLEEAEQPTTAPDALRQPLAPAIARSWPNLVADQK